MSLSQEKTFGCPHCKSTSSFGEVNSVFVEYSFACFESDGNPSDHYDSEVDWDTAEICEDVPRFICKNCSRGFDKPKLVAKGSVSGS